MTIKGARSRLRGQGPALAFFALACCAGPAQADLVISSPFLPANAQAGGAAAGPSGPIELRGVVAMPEGAAYCIFDVSKKKNYWVGLNEPGHEFVVKAADPGADTVTVDYQGRALKLTLRTAKVASSGSAAAPPGVPMGMPSAISSTVVVNPSPADEQRRLDAVSQEVRRRRQEREKALQDVQPGQGPGGGPPPIPNR